MRHALKTFIGILMALCLLICSVAGSEAVDPIQVSIEATGTEMSAPGEIQVTLRVTNTTQEDFASPISLYDPSGALVESFGEQGQVSLKADGFYSWSGVYTVTQEELEAGKAVYQIRYDQPGGDGVFTVTQDAQIPLTYSGDQVGLSATRTITPEVCREGKTVTVTYDLVNRGTVELRKIRVSDRISSRAQNFEKLAPGEHKTVTFTAKMGSEDLVSGGSVTYTVKGESESQQQDFPDVIIPKAVNDLTMSVTAVTPSIDVGETAVIRVTFTNNGNITYTGVTVRDQQKGEIFTGLEIPAGTVVERDREFTLTEPTSFKFSATMNDNTGASHELHSDTVNVQVLDPQKTVRLTLDLTCDHETISTQPAVVRFTLNVTNNSDVEATNIAIAYASKPGDPLYTFSSIAPGKTAKLEWDANISQSGKFRFTATASDALGNRMTFDSNTLEIPYVAPTAAPVTPVPATVAPLVTSAPPTEQDVNGILRSGRDSMMIVTAVLAALLALGLLLLIAAALKRSAKRRHSDQAYDHLELSDKRDYEEEGEGKPMDDGKAPQIRQSIQEQVEEAAALEGSLSEEGAPEPEVTVEDVIRAREQEAESDEGMDDDLGDGFRISRAQSGVSSEESERHRRSGRMDS